MSENIWKRKSKALFHQLTVKRTAKGTQSKAGNQPSFSQRKITRTLCEVTKACLVFSSQRRLSRQLCKHDRGKAGFCPEAEQAASGQVVLPVNIRQTNWVAHGQRPRRWFLATDKFHRTSLMTRGDIRFCVLWLWKQKLPVSCWLTQVSGGHDSTLAPILDRAFPAAVQDSYVLKIHKMAKQNMKGNQKPVQTYCAPPATVLSWACGGRHLLTWCCIPAPVEELGCWKQWMRETLSGFPQESLTNMLQGVPVFRCVLCVYLCVCMHVCLYVCVGVCVVCVRACCLCVYMCVLYMCVRAGACLCVCMHWCIGVFVTSMYL